MWHKADWDKVKQDPTAIHFPRQDWIFEHDAEKHAEDVYDEVVRKGKERAPAAAVPSKTDVKVEVTSVDVHA
jgi:hypothetical protein